MNTSKELINDSRYKDFETIRKTKLEMNNGKTLNVSIEFLMKKLREEHIEMVTAYYNYRDCRIYNYTQTKELKKQQFETELADLANMCYLVYMRLRGFKK